MNRLHVSAALFLLLSAPARADKVDDFVKAQMQERNIPGISIAVVRDGRSRRRSSEDARSKHR